MKHLMIDIETLDTKPSSVVLSIGAVLFDKDNICTQDNCYMELKLFPQLIKQRTISKETCQWWYKQPLSLKTQLKLDVEPFNALIKLNKYISENIEDINKLKVWGKGPNFDISIIESLMCDFDIPILWKFWNVRCVRTFIEYQKVPKLDFEGRQHNALDDALHQVKLIQYGLKKG